MSFISGYPLDRSLPGLLGSRGRVDMFVLEGLQPAEPVRQDFQKEQDDPWIVTPVDATVVEALDGGGVERGSSLRFVVAGGTADGRTFQASSEIAPDLKSLMGYERVLIAGPRVTDAALGEVVDTYFAYGLSQDGTLTSLMDSAGVIDPTFGLDKLKAALQR